MRHGTGGYRRGCRCNVCRGETAAYRARKRAEARAPVEPKPEPRPLTTIESHGTETGYTRGCRAKCCREAHAKAMAERRGRNTQKAREVTTLPEGRLPSPGSASAPGVVRYVAHLPKGIEHGDSSAYEYWACRCLACTAGANARKRPALRSGARLRPASD